ncbi:hypothetical protein H5T51_05635 [Candidatus Bathyarchaeota archaeon]|nr:hypothetical protein [Candidatus Bathyarchaeota archaeon]
MLILGESGRNVVYYHLQHSYGIKKDDILDHPEALMKCLRNIFGSGAVVIENSIIKILYQKLGMEYVEKKGCSFMQYLEDAKKAFNGV